MALLEVDDLTVTLPGAAGPVRVVDGLSLTLDAGRRLALVGESGSGKSVTALSLLRLLPGAVTTGAVRLAGEDVLAADRRRLRALLGSGVGMVFQDPRSALDPVMRIGDQVAEPLVVRGVRRAVARRRAAELLDRLGVPADGRRLDAYPHEFSGGMRQRVGIAMAVIAEPRVLIADEPTTALDVRVQAQVLDLLDGYAREQAMAVLLITHDLGIVAGFADDVAVLYCGRLVEQRPVRELYADPAHPYTRGLLASVPRVDADLDAPLAGIGGVAPAPADRPSGCAFHPRCPVVEPGCADAVPEPVAVGGGRVACPVVTRSVVTR